MWLGMLDRKASTAKPHVTGRGVLRNQFFIKRKTDHGIWRLNISVTQSIDKICVYILEGNVIGIPN